METILTLLGLGLILIIALAELRKQNKIEKQHTKIREYIKEKEIETRENEQKDINNSNIDQTIDKLNGLY